MTVAPKGTPLWHPQKDDFAPRLGVAWQARPNLVLRAGGGSSTTLDMGTWRTPPGTWPYVQRKSIFERAISAERNECRSAPFSTTLPASYMAVVDPNHVLPRTYEWNAAAEKSFGKADVHHRYLGAAGRKADAARPLPRAQS